MEAQLISLAVIMVVAFLAPILAGAIPGKPVPEVVFLVFAGAFLGPHMAGIIVTGGQAITMISDLGLGFLFLMAGYEINPRDLVGKTGAYATGSWFVSIAIALALAWMMPGEGFGGIGGLAFAIALTTTAYGTLAPIMRERQLTQTRVGKAVTVYGATGEVLPVIAMAFLLSSRSPIATALILLGFLLICVVLAFVPRAAQKAGSRVWRFLSDNAGKGSRPLVRMTVLILVLLLALSEVFDLDLVLGAFAAGFILRSIFPEGHKELEESIESVGNGFLIPAFFVISGAGIDLAVAAAQPLLVIAFIALLILVRGASVAISLHLNPETRSFTWGETFSCAAYCTMALPLIVAVTSVAVDSGAMTEEISSILVTAGALTVLIIPLVTSVVRVTSDAHGIDAVREVARHEGSFGQIWATHRHSLHEANAHYHELRRSMREQGRRFSATDYLATEHHLAMRNVPMSTAAKGTTMAMRAAEKAAEQAAMTQARVCSGSSKKTEDVERTKDV